MKLCRFEVVDQPGTVRPGIVYGGKVYETDGNNPIAVHESSQVRLLSPVGQPPSIRLFWCYDLPPVSGAPLSAQLDFAYLNPASLVPPSAGLRAASPSSTIRFDACLAVVIATQGSAIPPEHVEEHLLGYALATSFVVEEPEGLIGGVGRYSARARDWGLALGPAITTPDELDEAVVETSPGKRYRLGIRPSVNGRELPDWDVSDLPLTVAEIISYASESCPLQAGDVVCIAPPAVQKNPDLANLEQGDQVQIACDRLGTLTTILA